MRCTACGYSGGLGWAKHPSKHTIEEALFALYETRVTVRH